MPDHPAHHDQPSEPTAATGDHATTDPAPTTTADAPDTPAVTSADTPAAAGDTKVPGAGTDSVIADGDTAATPPNPAPDVKKPSAPAPRSGRRRTTRTAGTPRRPTTPREPAPSGEDGRVSVTAHDRVWAALRSHPGSTPAELSAAAGVARSTVAKLLTAWAADGSATFTPGATGRAGRAPQRWTAAPSDLPPTPVPDSADRQPDRDTGTGARRRKRATTTGTTPNPAPAGGGQRSGRSGGGAAVTGAAPVNGAGRNQSATPRLAAGALQGMVQDYLTEHPGDHGPTGVGRALGRSSGAVANALERLVTAGWAVRTNDRPRRYRTADEAELDSASPPRH
jgi:hypothetical protein